MTWNEYCDYCAEHVAPCLKTMEELTEHLKSYYGAVEVPGSEEERGELKNKVIAQKFEHLLSPLKPLQTDSTPEERRELVEVMKRRTEEMNRITAEELGLNMRFYKLPYNEHTAGFFADWAQQYGFSEEELTDCFLPFQAEMATGYFSCLSGRFQEEITLFLGVDEKDLQNRTGRFYQYVLAYMNQALRENTEK